jgi:hypothetical protein
LAIACPSCGQPAVAGNAFCINCGSSLAAPSLAPSPPPSAAPSLPAAFVSGRYAVRRFLGEGGKKKVYLVHDAKLDRDVAFSLIKTDGLDEVGVERITREAKLMGRLGGHPHVVGLYDIGDEGGQPYLVSELMGGGDVEGLIAKAPDHRVSLSEALRLVDEVCQALAYAHGHGIVHRDLKPGNVWLTKEGTAKLGDFGLAVSLDQTRLSVAGMIVGTVGYLPPEQALGKAPDARSDLYSLGAMLYELVTGRPPFLGDDAVAIIGQHLNAAPVAPTWHNPSVPAPLEALILRLLAKDPSQRPGSAQLVREEVAAIRAELAASGGTTPSEQRLIHDVANPLDRLAGGVFVGREREMDVLRDACDAAFSGRGGIVLVAGEPGIGKTRLAEEAATYAAIRGAQVLCGRCDEWEGTPAYWPWVQALRDYVHARDPERLRAELGSGAADIARVVSEVRAKLPDVAEGPAIEGESARFRLFDAVAAFLRQAATAQPLVIVLDDLHWADASTLLLLRFTVRELRSARVLLIGAYRDVEVGRHHPLAQTLAELIREPRTQRLVLRGLSDADVGRYLAQATGATAPAELIAAIARETAGNPFFITELVRLLASERRLDRADAGSWSGTLPQGVREVVGRRLDRLSTECNRVLGFAAVIGREFTADLLARAEEVEPADLLDLLAEAEQARIVREEAPGRWRFAQELTQETLYAELSPSQRVKAHLAIAAALETLAGADSAAHAAELAYHYLQAAPAGTWEAAVRYARQAGERAFDQLGYAEAAGHFGRALQALDLAHRPKDRERCELLLGLGEAQGRSGDAEAPATFRQAAVLAKRLEAGEMLARAALGFAGEGNTRLSPDQEMMGLLEAGLTAIGPGDSVLRGRLLIQLALASVFLASERTAVLSEDSEALARRLGDNRLLAGTLFARYIFALFRAEPLEEALPIAADAIAAADDAQDLEWASLASGWRLNALWLLGDASPIDAAVVDFRLRGEAFGHSNHRHMANLCRAQIALRRGGFAESERILREGEAAAEPSPEFEAFYTLCRFGVRREQGRQAEMEPALRALVASGLYTWPSLRALLALLLAETGRASEARTEVALLTGDDFALIDQSRVWRWNWMHALACLAEVCGILGDTDLAPVLYDRLRPFARYHMMLGGWAHVAGPAAYHLGLLATLQTRWAEAEEHFAAALEAAEQAGARPSLARSQYAYADMLLRRGEAGDGERALGLVDRALATSEDLGMIRLAEQALALKIRVQGILKA